MNMNNDLLNMNDDFIEYEWWFIEYEWRLLNINGQIIEFCYIPATIVKYGPYRSCWRQLYRQVYNFYASGDDLHVGSGGPMELQPPPHFISIFSHILYEKH